MRSCALLTVLLALCAASFAQTATPSSTATPDLERFSIDQVDKSLDPCSDFFQYTCSKWIKANPIPPDQGGWGTFNALALWNIAAVHNTLEEAAQPSPNRTPVQQKVGDYYAACMNEDAINKAGIAPLQPELDRIARMKDKSELPEVLASIHQVIRPANLNFIDAAYQGVVFGIYSQPGLDDASITLAILDQSGMALPGREFYLNDDAKSKEIRDKYVKHVARMLELSGEPQAQAATDAQTVLAMETELAKAAMDIVARRDPKNLNNKMSLQQIQAHDAVLRLEAVLCRHSGAGFAPVPDHRAQFLSWHGKPDPVALHRAVARLSAVGDPRLLGLFAQPALRRGRL